MTVSSDWENITWRTHFDAYLAMLRQAWWVLADKSRESLLARALHFVDDKDNRQLSFNDPTRTDSDTAELLLDVSKLRLSNIDQELGKLLNKVPQPRKLDIQKLRSSVKRIHVDTLSLSGLMSSPESELSGSILIEHAAVQILTASLLIECSEYLHPSEAFHTTREYASLASSISLASAAIRDSVSDLLPATRTVGRAIVSGSQGKKLQIPSSVIIDAISVTWPLFVVRAAKAQEQTMRDWAGQALFQIGKEARVPKALHLVRSLARLLSCLPLCLTVGINASFQAMSTAGLGVLEHLSDILAGLILGSATQ
jgi:hypothetical protein